MSSDEYFNLAIENAIFAARIFLQMRLRSDNFYGKILRFARLRSSILILPEAFSVNKDHW